MSCEICGHSDFELIGEKYVKNVQTKLSAIEFSVRLVCCKKCGTVFQNPLQSENKLQEYYSYMTENLRYLYVSSI